MCARNYHCYTDVMLGIVRERFMKSKYSCTLTLTRGLLTPGVDIGLVGRDCRPGAVVPRKGRACAKPFSYIHAKNATPA